MLSKIKPVVLICLSLNITLIFLISIFGRKFQGFTFQLIDRNNFFIFISIAFVTIFIILKKVLIKYHIIQNLFVQRSILWTVIMILSQYLIIIPEEKMHILLFSFFGFFCSHIINLYVGFFLAFSVSIADEILQHFLPDRYFGWDDILMNLFASLFTIFIFRFKISND